MNENTGLVDALLSADEQEEEDLSAVLLHRVPWLADLAAERGEAVAREAARTIFNAAVIELIRSNHAVEFNQLVNSLTATMRNLQE